MRDVNKVRKVGVAVASCGSAREGGEGEAGSMRKKKGEGGEFSRPFSRARFVPLPFSP